MFQHKTHPANFEIYRSDEGVRVAANEGLLFISYKMRVNTKMFQTTVSKPQGLNSALNLRCKITERLSTRRDSKESTVNIHQ